MVSTRSPTTTPQILGEDNGDSSDDSDGVLIAVLVVSAFFIIGMLAYAVCRPKTLVKEDVVSVGVELSVDKGDYTDNPLNKNKEGGPSPSAENNL